MINKLIIAIKRIFTNNSNHHKSTDINCSNANETTHNGSDSSCYNISREYLRKLYREDLKNCDELEQIGKNEAYNNNNYELAEKYLRNCLKTREQIACSIKIADCKNHLANVLRNKQKYSEAMNLYQDSINIKSHIFGNNHQSVASVINNLALLLTDIGEYQSAYDHFVVSHNLRVTYLNELEKYHDKDFSKITKTKELIAASKSNFGVLLYKFDRKQEAVDYLSDCIKLKEEFALDQNSRHTKYYRSLARNYENLGLIFIDLSLFDRAENNLLRCLEIRTNYVNENMYLIALSHNNLGKLYFRKKLYDDSLNAYFIAIKVYESSNSAALAESFHGISMVYSAQNNMTAAICFSKRAVNIIQAIRNKMQDSDSDKLDLYDQRIEYIYNHLSNLLLLCGRSPEAEYVMGMLKEKEQFEILCRGRVAGLSERIIDYNDSEARLIEQFDTKSASLYALGQHQEALKKVKEPTSTQKKELVEIKQRLEDVSGEFNLFLDSLHDVLPPLEVRQISKDSNALIDLTDAAPGTAAITTVTAEDTFHIILSTPHGRSAFSAEYRAEDIAKKILNFRELLKDYENNDYLPVAKELYDIIFRSTINSDRTLEAELNSGNITTLYWMLNGDLRRIPFAALHNGEQFLLEKYRTLHITTPGKIEKTEHEQWTGLGMGVTKAHIMREFDTFHELKALPSVKDELENIIARDNTNGVIPGDILLDEQFTRESMEEHLETGGYKAVHIASHFYLNPVNETLSYLLLGDGSRIRMDELSCKHRLFKDVDLVAFSACSTGLGTASTRGREVDSIGNMAEEQGAKTVLATLWDVEDKSTSMVMREFYQLRENRMTKAVALQQAQLALLKKKDGFVSDNRKLDFSHPYFWAPFIMIGNGG